jgi:hypothetical protein
MDENEKLKVFHESLVKANYAVPDYATFETTLSDPAKSKEFYDSMIKSNYELPDYETFTSNLGLKKKDTSEYGLPSKEVFSEMFGSISKPEVSERPLDEFDAEKFKTPDLSIKTPSLKGYEAPPLTQIIGDTLSKDRIALHEADIKKEAQIRITEIDKLLKEAIPNPKSSGLTDFRMLKNAPPYVDDATPMRDALQKEKDQLLMSTTQPDKIGYIFGRAYANSIIGTADRIANRAEGQAMEGWLSKYDAGTLTDVTATALGFMLDMPFFGTFGKIGAKAGQLAAKPFVNRAMAKTVDKLVLSGIEKSIAEKLAIKGASKIAGTMARTGASMSALGGYEATMNALNQWVVPDAEFEDIKWGQVLSSGMRGSVLGAGVAGLGIATSAIAKKAQTIKNVVGRGVTQAGVQAGGLTAESGLFVYGGAAWDGRPLKEVTGKEFAETVLLLGMLKGQSAIQNPKGTIANIRQSTKYNSGKPGEGIFKVDIEPWEIRDLDFADARTYEEGMKVLAKDDGKLAAILKDENVPALLKQKLLWGARGVEVSNVSLMADKIVQNENNVDFYNKEGVLVDRQKFVSKEEAMQSSIEIGLQLEDNKMQRRSAAPDVDRVKIISDLKAKGTDVEKLLISLDKPVSERTPEESKMVGDYYSMIPKEKKVVEKAPEEKIMDEYEQAESPYDAGARFSNGEKAYKQSEMDGKLTEVTSLEELRNESPDLIFFKKEAPEKITPVVEDKPVKPAKPKKAPVVQTEKEQDALDKAEKGKRKVDFKPGSRTHTAITKRPNDFTESALQYFAGGGRLNTEDFIRYTGFERGTEEFKKYFQLLSKGGASVDRFHEKLEDSFGMENKGAMDMINEVINLMKDHPSRGKMLTELERRQGTKLTEDEMPYEPNPEELKLEEEFLAQQNNARDLSQSYDHNQEYKDELITKAEYDEINDYLSRQAESERLAEESFNADIISEGKVGEEAQGGKAKGIGQDYENANAVKRVLIKTAIKELGFTKETHGEEYWNNAEMYVDYLRKRTGTENDLDVGDPVLYLSGLLEASNILNAIDKSPTLSIETMARKSIPETIDMLKKQLPKYKGEDADVINMRIQILEDYGEFIQDVIDNKLGVKTDVNPLANRILPEKLTNKQIGDTFNSVVSSLGRDGMGDILSNWNESRLNEDGTKIVGVPFRRNAVKGEGSKVGYSKKDFIDWITSDAPFDTKVYGEKILQDKEWNDLITRAREVIYNKLEIKPNDKPNQGDIAVSKGEEDNLPGGTEDISKPVEKQGEEKPPRTTDPAKQKQIEAIDKEYDGKIADAQKELEGMTEEKRNKVIAKAQEEINRRNTVFGDADAIKDGVIKTGDQGFKVTNKPVEEATRKFDERKVELTKQVDALNKERESKIGEVLKQQTLGFEETAKAEPTPQGIKFKDKTYTEVDQVLDALDKGEITFEESKPLRDQVDKFEKELLKKAEKNAKDITNRIDKGAGDIEDQIKKDIEDEKGKFNFKLLPDIWNKLGTAQWKVFQPARDALANAIAKQLKKGVTTQVDGVRWSTKVLTNLYNGLLRTQADMHGAGIPGQIGKLEMSGAREYGKYKGRQLLDAWRAMVNGDWDSLTRVWSVLDPELATKPTEKPLTYGDLGVAEKKLYFAMKDWMTWGHEITYANGLIPTKTYLKFKDVTGSSTYIARMYDKFEMDRLSDPAIREFAERGNDSYTSKIAADIYKARKELNGIIEINGKEYDSIESLKEARDNGDITIDQYNENKEAIKSDEWRREHAIKDPTYIVAKRIMQTIQNVAIKQYMDGVIANHPEYVLTIPKKVEVPKGFRRMGSSYAWGPFRNKVVASHIVEDLTGFFYQNALVNTTYDAMKMLDRTKFNQFYKKFRTIYNPFVQLGNITGNVFFATTNGINPVAFVKGMYDNYNLPKKNPALYESLLKAGYIGPHAMTGEMKPLDELNPKKGLLGRADEWATKAYVGADNLAKISAYQIYRRQGLSHEQALRRGYDAFQNYATVGKTWDFASKTPLIGPTFVKFQADLQRILVNSMLTTPLTTIGTFMLIKMLGNVLSALSGESEEEQKVRETRKGVPSIPFLNIPLSFKVGKSEINVARYLTPLYLYNKGDSEMEITDISKFMPYQIQKGEEGKILPKFVFADATWGFLGSVWTDKDFRNVSIADPTKTQFTDPNTPTDVKIWNIVNYVGRSQVPFWKGSADIYNAATGQMDYYGRKRTWYQAILNNVVKTQQWDDLERKNYVEHNLEYLTSKYASLASKMGDAQSVFQNTLKDAEDRGLQGDAFKKVFESASKLRDKSIKKSLEEQIPIFKEIEEKTNVYKKWYPQDEFIDKNFQNIEGGKVQRFNVLDGIDLQKKYPKVYFLLKKNNMLKKPDIPSFYNKEALTDEERKNYSNLYWSEYIRILDSRNILTQEEMDEMKARISRRERADTESGVKEITKLEDMATDAASRARQLAERSFRNK